MEAPARLFRQGDEYNYIIVALFSMISLFSSVQDHHIFQPVEIPFEVFILNDQRSAILPLGLFLMTEVTFFPIRFQNQ